MIDVKELGFGYQKKQPLLYDDFNLTINDGESVAILGFNGAGKSTLMKIMLGIIQPLKGDISIMNLPVRKKRKQIMRHVGVVWGQKPSLWWDVSIKRSYDTLAKMYDVDKQAYADMLSYLDSYLDVCSYWNQPLRNVSLGQRVKAEIMGALLHRPSLLVLDEPFIGLDFMTRATVIEVLKEYKLKTGSTLILTSHNIDDVQDLCERMVLLNEGAFIFDGMIQELLKNRSQIKEITITHERTITLNEYNGNAFYMESIGDGISKITLDTRKVEMSDFMQNILKNNQIVDIKIEGISLEYIIKELISMQEY